MGWRFPKRVIPKRIFPKQIFPKQIFTGRIVPKRVLPRRLFSRSLLIIVLPMILLQLIIGWVFIDRHWQLLTRRLADAVYGEISIIVDAIEETSRPPYRFSGQAEELARQFHAVFGLRLDIDPLASIAPSDADRRYWGAEGILADRLRQKGRPFVIDTPNADQVIVRIRLRDGGVLRTAFNRKRIASSATYLVFLWMIGSSIILITVALIILHNQIRPIRRLSKAMDRFGRGRRGYPVAMAGASEVRLAIRAFGRMRERITRLMEGRLYMLAAISHDLNTILTRMKLAMELMKKDEDKKALQRDIGEMQNMLKAYLAFAGDEICEEKSQLYKMDRLIREIAQCYDGKTGIKVKIDIQGEVAMELRVQSFRRCLTNIMDNALRYGRHIILRMRKRPDGIRIVIDDDGPGIDKKEYKRVFQPFYRLDRSRNVDHPNIGMGLSIARDAVQAHGGSIRLGRAPTPMKGLRVTIDLPI